MSAMQIEEAQIGDIPALLALARSVEHLFGPMVEHGFENVLRSNIERAAIICARDASAARAVGAIIFDSRAAPTYRVSWLAVESDYRGRGIGRRLLSEALSRAASPSLIEVITFGPDVEEGLPARRLYEALGFRAQEAVARGPEGGTRQRFELRYS
jgi:ribosomal protein S18 acetylase RimI-like enzyme